MGCVYEAVHRDLKKRVAIKTLLPSLATSDDARQRFLREGEAASRIRHPHVVDVTDVGAEGNVIYLVMEYLEGEDLARLIARQRFLTPEQTADIMLPVAAAIASAHEQGVIHRDLKPENIFLARTGYGATHPKVLDFGISKVLGDSRARALTGTSATMGTMNYLPPEQLRAAREADARSDQYGLGTILYECVTGQRAFDEESFYIVLKKIAEGEYVRPSVPRPGLAPHMEAIIMRSMSLEPLDRFESVKELGAALLEHAGESSRIVWSAFFGAPPHMDAPRPPSARVPSAQARVATMLAPPSSESSSAPPGGSESQRGASSSGPISGTMELPAPRKVPSTTFRNHTGERAVPGSFSTPRRSRAPMVVAGVALVSAVAVLIVLRGGNGNGRREDGDQGTQEPGAATPTPSRSALPENTRPTPPPPVDDTPVAPPPPAKVNPSVTARGARGDDGAPAGANPAQNDSGDGEKVATDGRTRKTGGKGIHKLGKTPGGHGKRPPAADGESAPSEPERAVPLPNQAPIIPL
jgi:serine/threonine-protein kinase